MNGPARHYPGAMSAVFITFGGVFAWSLVIVAFFGPEPDIGAIGVGQALGLGLVATLAARNVPAPQTERLGLCSFDAKYLPSLVLVVPVVVLLGELDVILQGLSPDLSGLTQGPELEAGKARLETLQSAIVVVGIAPVVEEFLFRGVLLQGTVATLGRFRGVLLTAVLFSMVHVAPMGMVTTPTAILVSSLSLGVVYALARLATGSLLAPLLLHVAVNAIGLYAATGDPGPGVSGFEPTPEHTDMTLLLPASIAVWIGLRGLWLATLEREPTLPLPADKGAAWRQPDDEGGDA